VLKVIALSKLCIINTIYKYQYSTVLEKKSIELYTDELKHYDQEYQNMEYR